MRSSSVNTDIDIRTIREMSLHSHCAPGAWERLLKSYGSKFKGRVLSLEDCAVLERLEKSTDKFHGEVKIYDVSRAFDKIKAIKQGIRKTQAIIIQGKKYESLEKILQLIE